MAKKGQIDWSKRAQKLKAVEVANGSVWTEASFRAPDDAIKFRRMIDTEGVNVQHKYAVNVVVRDGKPETRYTISLRHSVPASSGVITRVVTRVNDKSALTTVLRFAKISLAEIVHELTHNKRLTKKQDAKLRQDFYKLSRSINHLEEGMLSFLQEK